MKTALKRLYAGLLLVILLAAYGGQKVHIYTEAPEHFAAFSGDLVPDNGATAGVSERCIVDDYYFFPYLKGASFAHAFYARVLAVVPEHPTSCKLAAEITAVSLRAPPAA